MSERLRTWDVLADPDAAAACLAEGDVDPSALSTLAMVDPARLSAAGVVDAMVAWERLSDVCRAQQAGLMSRWLQIARDDAERQDVTAPPEARERFAESMDPRRGVEFELSAALHISRWAAEDRVLVAEQLTERLPATLAQQKCGRLSANHAAQLARACILLDDAQVQAVERRVLQRAGTQSPAAFRKSLQRALLATTPPPDAETEAAQEWDARTVISSPEGGAMGTFVANLAAPDLAAWHVALTALARDEIASDREQRRQARKSGAPNAELPTVRTMDQARADAFAKIGHLILTDPSLPRQHGRAPSVQVTVSLSTLLGIDDEPGELAGFGAVPAGLARELAFDQTGTWRRLVTDPTGTTLLDYGRTTYRPPRAPSDFVISRDQICQGPDCSRPAAECDLDHLDPFRPGRPDATGTTDPDHLHPLCRPHHLFRTHGRWRLHAEPDPECRCPDPATCPSRPVPSADPSEMILVSTADGPVSGARPVPAAADAPAEPPVRSACPSAKAHRRLVWTAPSTHTYRPSRPTFPVDRTLDRPTLTAEDPPF